MATTTMRRMPAPRLASTGRAISITASSLAWGHGQAGATATAGAPIASAPAAEAGITEAAAPQPHAAHGQAAAIAGAHPGRVRGPPLALPIRRQRGVAHRLLAVPTPPQRRAVPPERRAIPPRPVEDLTLTGTNNPAAAKLSGAMYERRRSLTAPPFCVTTVCRSALSLRVSLSTPRSAAPDDPGTAGGPVRDPSRESARLLSDTLFWVTLHRFTQEIPPCFWAWMSARAARAPFS